MRHRDACSPARLLAPMVAFLCAVCVAAGADAPSPTVSSDAYAVLLHGMGRSPLSMKRMEYVLRREGYDVVNKGYWGLGRDPAELTTRLDRILKENCTDRSRPIHFVTHSLGGILVRLYLAEHPDCRVGRVVMLSPPSRGSELSDVFGKWPVYRRVMGNTGSRLGTGTNDLARALPPVTFSLGIIAGNRTINPLYSYLIPGPDDGKVSVARARARGMTDFIVIPASHTYMMHKSNVIAQVCRFLESGHFDHGTVPGEGDAR